MKRDREALKKRQEEMHSVMHEIHTTYENTREQQEELKKRFGNDYQQELEAINKELSKVDIQSDTNTQFIIFTATLILVSILVAFVSMNSPTANAVATQTTAIHSSLSDTHTLDLPYVIPGEISDVRVRTQAHTYTLHVQDTTNTHRLLTQDGCVGCDMMLIPPLTIRADTTHPITIETITYSAQNS